MFFFGMPEACYSHDTTACYSHETKPCYSRNTKACYSHDRGIKKLLFTGLLVTRYKMFERVGVRKMTAPAERMKTMRERWRARGLRELRLVLPDARSLSVRQRVAMEVARLRRDGEDGALDWIEAVAEFDELDPSETP